jgi:hypothetical protein
VEQQDPKQVTDQAEESLHFTGGINMTDERAAIGGESIKITTNYGSIVMGRASAATGDIGDRFKSKPPETIWGRVRRYFSKAGSTTKVQNESVRFETVGPKDQTASRQDSTASERVTFRLDVATLESGPSLELTPQILAEELMPYLSAVASIQAVMNEIYRRPAQQIIVRSITSGSIDVSMDGAASAINKIYEIVVPWRRIHAQQLADLALAEKQAEIEK